MRNTWKVTVFGNFTKANETLRLWELFHILMEFIKFIIKIYFATARDITQWQNTCLAYENLPSPILNTAKGKTTRMYISLIKYTPKMFWIGRNHLDSSYPDIGLWLHKGHCGAAEGLCPWLRWRDRFMEYHLHLSSVHLFRLLHFSIISIFRFWRGEPQRSLTHS